MKEEEEEPKKTGEMMKGGGEVEASIGNFDPVLKVRSVRARSSEGGR